MNNNDRTNLIRRVSELEGLTDRGRSALPAAIYNAYRRVPPQKRMR